MFKRLKELIFGKKKEGNTNIVGVGFLEKSLSPKAMNLPNFFDEKDLDENHLFIKTFDRDLNSRKGTTIPTSTVIFPPYYI